MEKSAGKFLKSKLRLAFTGIGSLPFCGENAPNEAVDYVFEQCSEFPFWPQLPNYKKEEGMTLQFSDGMPGFKYDKDKNKFYFDDSGEEFEKNLDKLNLDYKKAVSSDSLFECENILNKYKISYPYSSAIDIFLNKLKKQVQCNSAPDFIKGAVTGPFTFLVSFFDKNGKSAYYNEKFRDCAAKILSLKALWQIKEFKKNSPQSMPVIFVDEPTICITNSYTHPEVKNEDIVTMLKTVIENIKKFKALSGIHCCERANLDIITLSNPDIINFDAYSYFLSIDSYFKEIENFIKNGGFLAFGIVPTRNKDELIKLDDDTLYEKFQSSINYLSKYIDKKLVLNQCFITPSCGCGSLNIELAKKALNLAKKLSTTLKQENEVQA